MKLPPEIIQTAQHLAQAIAEKQQAHDLRRQGKAQCASCLFWRMNPETWERGQRQGGGLPSSEEWGGMCCQSPKQGVSKLNREWCGEFRPFAPETGEPAEAVKRYAAIRQHARALIQQGKAHCKDCLYFECIHYGLNYGYCHHLPKPVYIKLQHYYCGEFVPKQIKS